MKGFIFLALILVAFAPAFPGKYKGMTGHFVYKTIATCPEGKILDCPPNMVRGYRTKMALCKCVPQELYEYHDFKLGKVFKGVGKVFKGVGKVVKPVIKTIGKVISNPIVGHIASFIPYVGPAIKIASTAMSVAKGIKGFKGNPLGAIASIGGAVGGLGGMGGHIGKIASIAGKVGHYANTAQTVIGAAKGFKRDPLGAISSIGGAIGGLNAPGKLGKFTNFAGKVGQYAGAAQSVIGAAKGFKKDPLGAISTIGGTIGGLPVPGKLQKFTNIAGKVGQYAGAAQTVIGAAKGFRKDPLGSISTIGGTIGGLPVPGKLQKFTNIAGKVGQYAGAAQTVIGAAKGFKKNPLGSVATIGQTIGSLPVPGRFQKVTQVAGKIGNIAGKIQPIASKIGGLFRRK